MIPPGLVPALCRAYADLLRRQRTASAAFVRWNEPGRRAHEFAWVGPGMEAVLTGGRDLRVTRDEPLHAELARLRASVELNPYERELRYGYPYVVGRSDGQVVRAPLLTVAVELAPDGTALAISPAADVARFNSLPFRTAGSDAARDAVLARLIDDTPAFPVTREALDAFAQAVERDLGVERAGALDGTVAEPPARPEAGEGLRLVDAAAVFVAPRTGYFLASDLERIAELPEGTADGTALGALLGSRGSDAQSETFAGSTTTAYFPFPSNPAQERVALLAERPENRVVVVQGPPGTGKSLTIANTVAHLVASGQRVLVTSQKDEALRVVDEQLRRLELSQLPMTLLRQDADSKRDLRERLASLQKSRSAVETAAEQELRRREHAAARDALAGGDRELRTALVAEHDVFGAAARRDAAQGFVAGLRTGMGLRWTRWRAGRQAPVATDVLGERQATARTALRQEAVDLLATSAEHRFGAASRVDRNRLREFAAILGRRDKAQNFSVFDRLKADPDRCEALLGVLPCWVMTPDDVARLFPCTPGLFDVVAVDEASQCDLPSMAPVLFRARRAVIAGDSRQMQARRFAFTAEAVSSEAAHHHGLARYDPDGWLDATRSDLLRLAAVRADEEVLLDEHFRSLPPLIAFSNGRWYGGRLRLMRHARDRRHGDPGRPPVRLIEVPDGRVEPGTQENEPEARALLAGLAELLRDPAYARASVGVICLFEEQVRLLEELVAEAIDEEAARQHRLVVVNPDGFQGDVRDVILYSLSYDGEGMTKAQLSARQAEQEHVQGMLNVAFTRARDEVRVYHSAPLEQFATAAGTGALRDWLVHLRAVAEAPALPPEGAPQDGSFGAAVRDALRARGLDVHAEYPAAGLSVDLVAEQDGRLVAVECDGALRHPAVTEEDASRQAILERAGWRVVRIPFRAWLRDRERTRHLGRVDAALAPPPPAPVAPLPVAAPAEPERASAPRSRHAHYLTAEERAILVALGAGSTAPDDVLRGAREALGYARLGPRIRRALEAATASLAGRGLVVVEDGEVFATEEARALLEQQAGAGPTEG